jgi:hypothetical protein
MKKFKWFLILWALVLLSSCQHYLVDKPGIITDVKMLEHDKWKYEVIISGQDISTRMSGRYHFYTNQLYQVGDTVYIGKIYNQSKDTIQ